MGVTPASFTTERLTKARARTKPDEYEYFEIFFKGEIESTQTKTVVAMHSMFCNHNERNKTSETEILRGRNPDSDSPHL